MIEVEIASKAVVIVAVVVVLLVAMMTFFFQSSGSSVSTSDAERVFNTQCQAYARAGCSWEETYKPEFSAYLSACRIIYGDERDSYSCMYTLCQGCFETSDVKCAGLCNLCSGSQSAGVDRKACCTKYSAQCAGSTYDCSSTC